jgi:adenylate cyclase
MPEWEPLLEGLPDAEARDGRRRLLDELHAEGFAEKELARAVREDRLSLLVIEQILGGGRPKYTMRQASEVSGLDLDWLIRTRRALGIAIGDPDDVTLTDRDIDAFKLNRAMYESGLPEEAQLSIYRALGSAMARYTDALRTTVTEALLAQGGTEYELSQRFRAWMGIAMPVFGPALEYTGRTHLLERLRQDILTFEEVHAGRLRTTVDTAVAFVDVVGFTQLGEELPEEELGSIAQRLVDAGMAAAKPPVRLVKSIGDALMLVCPEPEPLVVAALTLVDESPDLPEMRGGLAFGPALARDGDWYGSTVNLAARLCDRARPGSVLTTAAVCEGLGDGYRFSHAGPKRLKGIADAVSTVRVRREEA